MTIEPEVAFDKIKDLSADEIAKFFEQEGIQGYVGKLTACPIANYLTRETGQCFIVGAGSVYSKFPMKSSFHVELNPPGVMNFVIGFDNGDYPELKKEVAPRVGDNYGS